ALLEVLRLVEASVHLRSVLRLERHDRRISPGVVPKRCRRRRRDLCRRRPNLVLLHVELGWLVAERIDQSHPFLVRRYEALIAARHRRDPSTLASGDRHRVEMTLARMYLARRDQKTGLVFGELNPADFPLPRGQLLFVASIKTDRVKVRVTASLRLKVDVLA